jgi:hypothetical protein
MSPQITPSGDTGVKEQRDFFPMTDCELGEIYKLAKKMAHLGGDRFWKRIGERIKIIHRCFEI